MTNSTLKETKDQLLLNTTRLIKFNYENKTPLPKEIIAQINLLEIGKKDVTVKLDNGENYKYHIEESNLINMITHLPVEYYRDYFDINWIDTKHHSNKFGKYIFQSNRLEFMREYLLFAEEPLKNMDVHEKFNYSNNVLSPFLELNENFNHYYSSLNPILYKEIFDICLKQYYDIFQSINPTKRNPNKVEKWFLSNYSKNGLNFLGKKEELMKKLSANPNGLIFIKEIFQQCEKAKLSLIEQFKMEDLMQSAITSFNFEGIKYLSTKMNYSNEKIKDELIKSIKNYGVKNNTSSQVTKLKLDDKNISFILNCIEHYQIKDYFVSKDLSFLLTAKSDTLKEKIFQLFPKIQIHNLIGNLNKDELVHSYILFTQFMNENNLNNRYRNAYASDEKIKKNLFALNFSLHLKENFPYKDISLINEDTKDKILYFVEQNYLPFIYNQNKDDLNIIFNNYKLQQLLEQKETATKKYKI